MSDTNQQRVHPATPRRRQLARAAGQLAISRELVSAATLLTAIGGLIAVGPALARQLLELTAGQFQVQVAMTPAEAWDPHLRQLLFPLARIAAPALIAVLAIPLLVHLLQTRFHFHFAGLAPDLGRISPLAAWQKMASADRFGQASLAIVKSVLLLGIGLAFLYLRRDQLLGLIQLEVHELGPAIFRQLGEVVLAAVAIVAALAVGDYVWQRWRYERQLMMTPRELRDELRAQEGDPTLNARRRAVQRQLAAQRATAGRQARSS